MVFRVKLLNLTRIDCTHGMPSKMFQIAVVVSSTISNPIALCRQKLTLEHESNQSETVPPLPSLLAVPVNQRKFLPTAADDRPQIPCAPWDRFWVSEPFAVLQRLLNQFLRLKFMREGEIGCDGLGFLVKGCCKKRSVKTRSIACFCS